MEEWIRTERKETGSRHEKWDGGAERHTHTHTLETEKTARFKKIRWRKGGKEQHVTGGHSRAAVRLHKTHAAF